MGSYKVPFYPHPPPTTKLNNHSKNTKKCMSMVSNIPLYSFKIYITGC